MFGNPIKDPKLVAVEIIRTEKYIEQIEAEIAAIENNVSYRGSFEWRFEFPKVLNDKGDFVGFDAVIGNPPYKMIQPHNTSENEIALMKNAFEIADFKIDLFHLFYQAGINILISNGFLSYITPSSLLNNVTLHDET